MAHARDARAVFLIIMICPDTIKTVTRHWHIPFKTIRSDIDLYGSPERSLFRAAVEDETGVLFVLERIDPVQQQRRRFIGEVLEGFFAAGLKQIPPYLRTTAGELVAYRDGCCWQISPYIQSLTYYDNQKIFPLL